MFGQFIATLLSSHSNSIRPIYGNPVVVSMKAFASVGSFPQIFPALPLLYSPILPMSQQIFMFMENPTFKILISYALSTS